MRNRRVRGTRFVARAPAAPPRGGRGKLPYSHFVGVLAPPELADAVEECRAWMAARYGCSAGYRTAPHVTVIPPFALPELLTGSLLTGREERPEDVPAVPRLEETLAAWASRQTPFEGRVTGFGAFAERTIFASLVEDPRWTAFHDSLAGTLADAFPGLIPRERRPYVPHLTVANRDIPPEALAPALEHFASLALDKPFPVDHVALFEWTGGLWSVRSAWPAGSDRG